MRLEHSAELVAGWRERAALPGPRSWIYLALGLLMILGFGVHSHPAAHFRLADLTAVVSVPDVVLPVRMVALVCGTLTLALALLDYLRPPGRGLARAIRACVVLAFVVSFLAWADAGHSLSLPGLAASTVVGTLPILLGAQAGVLCERAGVINVAIEAQFLLGAFTASVFASLYGAWTGLATGAAAGAVVGACLAVFAIRYLADQIVVGIVLTLLVQGLTSFLFTRVVIPHETSLNSPPVFGNWRIPGLADIPVVGTALFDQTVFWYLAIALLVVLHLGLYRTRWGLRVQAVGERPEAAARVGIDVIRIRYQNVIAGGLVAGVAGAFLSVGSVGAFNVGISSGKGFIALAAVIFGRWTPLGAFAAALLFGFTDATQSVLSILGGPIPSAFLQMFPYVVTVMAVAGLVGRARPPAADGMPFSRG